MLLSFLKFFLEMRLFAVPRFNKWKQQMRRRKSKALLTMQTPITEILLPLLKQQQRQQRNKKRTFQQNFPTLRNRFRVQRLVKYLQRARTGEAEEQFGVCPVSISVTF